jgi:KaiC/GvpD/RAD55 family RecA-like ATPase
MAEDALPTSLQQSVLVVLAYDDKHGAAIAAQVLPEHFDGPYRDLVERVLRYRRKYSRPPGTAQLDDLIGQTALGGKNRDDRARELLLVLEAESKSVNAEYTAARVAEFIDRQLLKRGVMEAGERFRTGTEDGLAADVRGILQRALRGHTESLSAGTFLSDPRALNYLDAGTESYPIGIPELDKYALGPTPKELLLYIAPKGCLIGETFIDCPRDLRRYPHGIPISQLVGKQFYTYSWDAALGRPCLARVLDVWSSGVKRVYRVTMAAKLRQKLGKKRGGTRRAMYLPPCELVGTYDHPVMLSDGSWKKLGELQPGDALMSLYRRAGDKSGRTCLTWTGLQAKGDVWEHQFVCAERHGARPGTPEQVHAHHRDRNPLNNAPDNLEWKSAPDHWADHLRQRNLERSTGWQKTGVHPRGMLGKTHAPEAKARQRAGSQRAVADAKAIDPQAMVKRGRLGGRPRASPNHTVVSVEYLGRRETFDMEVEDTSNFVANGVVVHNSGKSWFCVHCGKHGLAHGLKVLHITLEMSERRVVERYHQSMFGMAKHAGRLKVVEFELDKLGRFVRFDEAWLKPALVRTDPAIRKKLEREIEKHGRRFANLVVKEFPSGQLTTAQLAAYLDYLEAAHRFVPNMLIIDYPDLMKQSRGEGYRHSLGQTFVDIRGLCVERGLAGVAPTQGTRSTIHAKRVTSKDVAEDISKVQTADMVYTFARTAAEERYGLGRLHVAHARNEGGGLTLVLSQSYATGQYVLESTLMQKAYWDQLRRERGDDEVEDADDED